MNQEQIEENLWLIEYCISNNMPVHELERLLNEVIKQDSIINIPIDSDKTALHLAVIEENKDMIVLLLNKNADINAQDINGNTPLHLAYTTKNEEIIILLINQGANVNLLNEYSLKPHEINYLS